MRLLNVSSLTLSEFRSNEIPPYAILSHRWSGHEATYKDVRERRNVDSEGYRKILGAASCVKKELDDIPWLWVDTCCINKASSAEISEAVNSMYRWYQKAAVCLVYLADVTASDNPDMFRSSSWFSRGWTLQELLAPQTVLFFTRDWEFIGSKGSNHTRSRSSSTSWSTGLESAIENVTGIPRNVLHDYRHIHAIATAEKWRWTENRETTRPEDKIYALLGLFDVTLPVMYGEGFDNAMTRLSTQLRRKCSANDMSWDKDPFYSDSPRISTFVDRSHEMEQIATKLAAPSRRVALTGIAGIGKTQLAVEYVHRLRATSPYTSVFWFSNSGAAPFQDTLKEMVQQLVASGVDGHRLRNGDKDYGGDESNDFTKRWLVILDGIDEVESGSDVWNLVADDPDEHSRTRAWLDHRSIRGKCSILITSRSRHTAQQLVGCSDTLEIGPLGVEEGALLVKKSLGGLSVEADDLSCKQLSMALDNMPIAVAQVSRHIRTKRSRTSTAEWIQDLVKDKSWRLSVLEGRDLDDGQAKDSVLSIWYSSFEYMIRRRPSMFGMLSAISQCNHTRWTRSFFDTLGLQYQRIGGNEATTATCFDGPQTTGVEEDILVLLQHSFLKKSAEHEHFEMFELVQLAIRGWLVGRGQFDRLQPQYVGKLRAMLSQGHLKGHLGYRALSPQARTILDDTPRTPDGSLQWASLMHTSAWFALSVGNTSDARTMAELSVQVRARELGSDHIKTRSSMGLVALAKQGAGMLKDAAALGKEVVAESKALLGEEHPLTLTNMANLSWTLQEQNRWKEAEAMEQHVLDGTRKILGSDHPVTLASMHNMASIMRHTGRLDKAQGLMNETLAWEKAKLGEDHPATLTTTDNLALLLQSIGRLQAAETMSRRALEGFEKVLGLNHADTWTSSHNLASILRDGGKLQESCTLLRRTAEKREQILGEHHAHTLSSLSSLASVLKDMGQYDEAERLNRIVLEARARTLGAEHPQTLTSVSNLGLVLRCRGEYREAEMLSRRALEGYRRILGHDHPHTITSCNNLADLLQEQGVYRTVAEERRSRSCRETVNVETATGKQKRLSVGSLNLAIRGQEKVKRSRTKVAQS